MKMFDKDFKNLTSKIKEIELGGVIGKIGKLSADAGKSTFTFAQRKIEENNIQEAARYHYYSQFTNEQLEEIHQHTDVMKEQVSIKELMRKRGYKYDYDLEMFYPGNVEKVIQSEKVHQLQGKKFRNYEEIEKSLMEQRASRHIK